MQDYDSADEFGGSLLDRLKLSRDAGDGKKAGKGLPQAKATKSAKAGAASKLAKGKADGMVRAVVQSGFCCWTFNEQNDGLCSSWVVLFSGAFLGHESASLS